MDSPFSLSVDLTPCQQKAYSALRGAENVFVTGGAGSGKSFLIRYFLKEKDSRDFPVLASTGAAAVLVGGRTFHSFFGLGIMEGGVEATVEKASKNRQVVRRLKKISGFIVDEVSMLSGPTLRAAEIIARRVRDSDLPWGGLRIVAVGDFAQLPPVERNRTGAKGWAFLDPVWDWSSFNPQVLRTQTRCKDDEYMKILNFVRAGIVNAEVKDYLDGKTGEAGDDFDGTRLFPRREETERFNLRRLEGLPAAPQKFETIYSGDDRSLANLKKFAPIPDLLILKEGALVMLRQNDPQGRWVNGSTGHVEKISGGRLQIRLLNGRLAEIEKSTFAMLDAEGDVVAAAVNFPVSLAWASTIHKAQGATLDRLAVNLSQLWEPGQAYVALSRLTEGRELKVERWEARSIRVDPDVAKFYRAALLKSHHENQQAPPRISEPNQAAE